MWLMMEVAAPTDPKFRTVAKRARSCPGNAFSLFMEVCAWRKTHPSLAGFVERQLEVMADFLDITLDEAQRLWQAFEDLGMRLGDELRAWTQRQGRSAAERPRSRNAERQARWRAAHPGKRYQRALRRGVTRNTFPLDPLSHENLGEPPPKAPPLGGVPSSDVTRDKSRTQEEAAAGGNRVAQPGLGAPRVDQLDVCCSQGGDSDVVTSHPGGRMAGRRSPQQTLFDASRRIGAARKRALVLSAGRGAADPGPGDGLASAAA